MVFAIVCVVDGDYGCNGVTAELLYSYNRVTQKGVRRAKAAEITLDSFDVGVGELPWHPGAQRYYQEVGALAAE